MVLLTQAGGVLNLGVGIANSGDNEAIGNSSDNGANRDADEHHQRRPGRHPLVGPQIASNGGGASNTLRRHRQGGQRQRHGHRQRVHDHLRPGGRRSTAPWRSPRSSGGTANAGLGLANVRAEPRASATTRSTTRVLEQTADGSGIVSNQGEASNESDGTAIIGDPSKCDDVPETEKTPGLPRTGGPLEVEAAIALMLLLAGFGLRRTARHLA